MIIEQTEGKAIEDMIFIIEMKCVTSWVQIGQQRSVFGNDVDTACLQWLEILNMMIPREYYYSDPFVVHPVEIMSF